MNRTYRTIWSDERRSPVVVSELTSSRTKSGSGSEAVKKTDGSFRRFSALTVAVASALTAAVIPLSASAAPDRMIEIGGYKFASTYDGVSSYGSWHPAEDTSSTVVDWSFDFDTNNGQEVLEGQTFEITAGQYTMWESMAATGEQALTGNAEVVMQGGTTPGAFVFNTLADGSNAHASVALLNLTIRGGSAAGAVNIAARNGGSAVVTAKEVSGGNGANAHGIGIGASGEGSSFGISATVVGGTVSSSYGIAFAAYNGGSFTANHVVNWDEESYFFPVFSGANQGSAVFALAMSTDGSDTEAYLEAPLVIGGMSTAVLYGAYGKGSWIHISNEGDAGSGGSQAILGGESDNAAGIGTLAYGKGSAATIYHTGFDQTLKIAGGAGQDAYGIGTFADTADSGETSADNKAEGSLTNSAGGGTVLISGGSGTDSHGIARVAYGAASHVEFIHEGRISEGEALMQIQGGSGENANGIDMLAGLGGEAEVRNVGTGLLKIVGGTVNGALGIDYSAHGAGSSATIANASSGTLSVSGGTGPSSHGIMFNAFDGGTSTVSNAGEGSLTISGGDGENAIGISRNSSGAGSVGTISNSDTGELIITGGNGYSAYGIAYNAADGATGFISNESDGSLTITGGNGLEASSYGLSYNGYEGGSGTIRNAGRGTLTISAGSGDDAFGIAYNAYEGGKGTISNEGGGTLNIRGEYGTNGLFTNASRNGGEGSIINSGSGLLLIDGGSISASHGMYYNASYGATGTIRNTGTGTITIRGGTTRDAYGLYCNTYVSGSTGTIENAAGGTLNILGNKASWSYGIGFLAGSIGSTGRLENAGTMNLNKYAIRDFGNGDALVTNKASGTVNAEAEAIFAKTETTVVNAPDISVFVANADGWTTEQLKLDSFQTSGMGWSWNLKDDWANRSVWEDGGNLVITDVMDGSTSAKQITEAFQEKFGTGTTLTFKGENDDASTDLGTPKFTVAVANDLIAKGYAGAIVSNFNLDASDDAGTAKPLVVGAGGADGISDSIGFRQIQGASSVTVTGGRTLALIGNIEGQDLIEGGGKVDLDNGALQLGVDAGTAETTGYLMEVSLTNNSKVSAENGWFRMTGLSGSGDVSVAENGRLYAADMNVAGDVDNDGTISADSLTISGGTFTTSKVLKSEGKISVTESGTLSADGILASDTLDVKGVLKRGKSVSIYTGKAAMKLMRERHEDVAAELDRLEGKTEASTMSVLDRIVAQSMKAQGGEDTDAEQEGGKSSAVGSGTTSRTEDSSTASTSSSSGTVVSPHRRAAPVMPADAQAFAAFDAVNRVVSNIEDGVSADGHGLWVKLLTGESEFGVRSGSKFELDSDGAVIGAEGRLNPNWKVGAALSYLDGEIDSGALKSDWKSYGLTAYAHYRAGDFGLKGSAGWLRGTTKSTEDYDADVWHACIRSEYDFAAGPVTVTPFFGGRLMSGSFDGMASQTVVSVPVGLKIAGELQTAGWTFQPAMEASYARSLGDTEAKDVRFLPKDAFTGALSVRFEKDSWSGELAVRGASGSNDYEDRAFTAKVGLKF